MDMDQDPAAPEWAARAEDREWAAPEWVALVWADRV